MPSDPSYSTNLNTIPVARAARPGSFQFTLKFVGFQAGMEAVCGKQFQGRMEVFGDVRMFLRIFLALRTKALERSKSRITRGSLS
jgi:hypothetical protein